MPLPSLPTLGGDSGPGPRRKLDDSVLSNLGRFANRLGYAVRSGLQGDVTGAGKNLIEFASDAVTGGFLKQNFNAARIGAKSLGYTDAPTPELSDVVKTWGFRPPSPGLGRTLFDIGGSIATDPTTYLTLGSGGAARGALGTALGATAGTGRRAALALAREGLSQTPKGAGLLAATEESLFRGLGLRAGDVAGQLAARAAQRGRVLANPNAVAAKLERRIAETAVERIFGTAFKPQNASLVESTAEDLFRQGIFRRPHASLGLPFTSLRWRIPGTEGPSIGQIAWGVARNSPYGLVTRAAREWEPVAWALDSGANGAKALYSKYLVGKVPDAVRQAAEWYDLEKSARRADGERWLTERIGLLSGAGGPAAATPHVVREAFARAFHEVHDKWRALDPAGRSAMGSALQRELEDTVELFAGKDGVKLAQQWQQRAAEQVAELRNAGVWTKAVQPSPFYFPRQIRSEVREAFGSNAWDAAIGERKYGPLADWEAAVYNTVNLRAARDPEFKLKLQQAGIDPAHPGSAIEWDAGRLLSNRLTTQADTIAKARFKAVVDRFKGTAQTTAAEAELDAYFQKVWAPLGTGSTERTGLQAVLGGGRLPSGQRFRGLNYYYKGLLYAPWPSSWFRDFYGTALATAFDPDIGAKGALSAFMRTLYDVPILRTVAKSLGPGRRETQLFLEAARPVSELAQVPARQAARAAVQDLRVGRYSGQEVLDAIDQVVGRSTGPIDVDWNPERLAKLGIELRGAARGPVGRTFDKFAGFGYGVAAHLDRGLRVQHLMALIEKGVDPAIAAQRVQKFFVNYDLQGKADRWFRDLTLFGRYPLAIVPAAAEGVARNPGFLTTLGAVKGTAAEQGDSRSLPEHLRSGLAIPITGGRWLTSLGTPIEAAAQSLEGVSSPAAFRRQWLASLTPLLRLPLEATADTSFRFGGKFGSYRSAPEWLPDALTTEVAGPTPRREIPGWVNELLRGLPTARGASMIDQFMRLDEKNTTKDWKDFTVGALTGARTQKLDEQRARVQQNAADLEEALLRGEVGEIKRYYRRGEGDLTPEAEAALAEQAALERARRRNRGRGLPKL